MLPHASGKDIRIDDMDLGHAFRLRENPKFM